MPRDWRLGAELPEAAEPVVTCVRKAALHLVKSWLETYQLLFTEVKAEENVCAGQHTVVDLIACPLFGMETICFKISRKHPKEGSD